MCVYIYVCYHVLQGKGNLETFWLVGKALDFSAPKTHATLPGSVDDINEKSHINVSFVISDVEEADNE